ncbi:MAG: sulfatase [Nitrospirota bacterium]|nr:sulfatase [Nitrospirota bacterium]
MKPNIILISIDTLRADHLSCYGYHRPTTPNIDRLAAEGTIYRQNYSTGVWTPPGHASMLTGLYVSEHGVYGEKRLADEIPTVATILKENGYQTAGFVNNSQVGELVGFNKGHDLFVEVWKGVQSRTALEKIINGGFRKIRSFLSYEDMGAKRTNLLFLDWINRTEKDKPFYSFLHYIEPHNPLSPPIPFRKQFLRKYKNINKDKVKKIAHNPLICYVEDINLNDNEVSYIKDLYDGEIAYTDSVIGEIVSRLRNNNIYDNTMIVITSDHGEHFGEYGHWSHVASLHKEVLHVPLIIKYPEGIDCHTEVDGYTQLVDIFPTIMGIAGVSKDELTNVSGINLLKFKENQKKHHEHVFAEWEGRVPFFIAKRFEHSDNRINLEMIKSRMIMIQNDKYKYISSSDGNEEFYDISDGKEILLNKSSLSNRTLEDLKNKLFEYRKLTSVVEEDSSYSVDEEIAKNLKSLGYM